MLGEHGYRSLHVMSNPHHTEARCCSRGGTYPKVLQQHHHDFITVGQDLLSQGSTQVSHQTHRSYAHLGQRSYTV